MGRKSYFDLFFFFFPVSLDNIVVFFFKKKKKKPSCCSVLDTKPEPPFLKSPGLWLPVGWGASEGKIEQEQCPSLAGDGRCRESGSWISADCPRSRGKCVLLTF